MDPVKAKFYQANFEIESGGHSLSLKGLVSESGVTKIFQANMPAFWDNQVGRTITLRLDRMVIEAVWLKQFVEHGSFYELRFRGLEEAHRNYIRQRIASEGISPGWQRQFPRIPVNDGQDPSLPVPSLCMVHFLGKEVFVNVVNFTLGGLRIETIDDELKELRVGSVVQFDLGTSSGGVMPNLTGEIRNVAEQERTEEGGTKKTRAFGLRIINWDPVNERKYKELIKDYCLAMQKNFEE
jgi:hypothetical protein